jgi:nucleoside-diphosphate-sugar epimerase
VSLLVLGAPRFLGRAIADAAIARGHELTFFNRGRTNPGLYPEATRIVGDRAGAVVGGLAVAAAVLLVRMLDANGSGATDHVRPSARP